MLLKKLKKIDQEIDSINQINLTNKIVEELLSKANPDELFGKDGLFQQLKKRIVERVLASELEHDLGYSKHSKVNEYIFYKAFWCNVYF